MLYLETNSVARGTIQIASTYIIQYLITGIFYIIVTRTGALTQTDIGILSILDFIATTFCLFTVLALPTALTKFASENLGKNQPEEAAAIQRTITRTVIILSLAGFSIATLFSGVLSQYLLGEGAYAPLIILISGYALLLNLITLYNSGLQALRLFGKMATVTIVSIVSGKIIAIILTLLRLNVTGVLIGQISGSLIALTAAVSFIRGRFPNPHNNANLKPLLHFSFPLFLGSSIFLILNWADIVVVFFITSNPALVGIYSIVIKSIGILSIIWFPIMTTIFPVLSAQYGLQKPENISNVLKAASRYLAYAIFPACLGLASIAPTALTFFYGPNYTSGAAPLVILSIATIILSTYYLFSITLTAIGKTKNVLKINAISAVSSIMLLLVMVPPLEATGAALARLIVPGISLALAAGVLQKEIKVRLDKEAIWKSALASMAFVPFLAILERTISTKISIIQVLTLEFLVAACTYLASLYLLKALNNQDFELLRQAFPKSLAKYLSIIERIVVR